MEERRRSVLDNESSKVFGYPLTIKQQIWCHYVIPGFGFLVFYVLNFSLDLSVGLELINEHKKWYGSITIILLYLPGLVCYLQELYNLPSPHDCKTIILWQCKELGKLIIFPMRILKCLGVQLYWIVELIKGKEDQEHALKGFEESFDEAAETYLFSQIFLQNIPQALLQFHMITVGTSRYDNTEVIQVICSLVSLTMAAQGIMRLHRYESQRIGGRKPLWEPSTSTEQNFVQPCQENPQENPLIPRPIPTGIQLPTRNPRTKALEEDNPAGKLLFFLYWFTFLFARIITIITAMNFFPKIVISVILIHIVIMFLYYLWYPIKIHKKIFLTITSTFFLIEVGIRIKKIAYLYFLFIVSTLVEDVGLTLLWYIWGKWHRLSEDGWWFNYIVYVDINAHFLSLIFFSLYLALFKPKVKYLPPDNKSSNSARSSMIVQ